MDLHTAQMFQKTVHLISSDVKFKQDLVTSLNANIDLPFINEDTEEFIIKSLLNTVTGVLAKTANQAVDNAQQHSQ